MGTKEKKSNMPFAANPDKSRNGLLIAMPQLLDPNFLQSVSLVVSFDETGAFGFVLNKPTQLTAEKILEDKISLTLTKDIPVYLGGPVQTNSFWFLHAYPEFHDNGQEVLDSLFVTTNFETVEKVLEKYGNEENPLFRFLLGYAGWAPGQLEKELSLASWITGSVDINELFSCKSKLLWKTSLKRLGVSDPNALVAPQSSGAMN